MRSSINKIIINKEKDSYYPQKDAVFDISSLVNQLYKSKFTYPQRKNLFLWESSFRPYKNRVGTFTKNY